MLVSIGFWKFLIDWISYKKDENKIVNLTVEKKWEIIVKVCTATAK